MGAGALDPTREAGVMPLATLGARAQWSVVQAALVILVPLVLFWPTTLSMIQIWRRSDTYAHGFLVVPVVLWLIWKRREVLAALPLRPFWPGVLAMAAAALIWLVGELGSAVAVSQFGMIGMVIGGALLVLGLPSARALAFPLAFLLLAVPFGEVFVPTLIDWTADFTVAAVRLVGVPVYREGNDLVIPTGRWSVVDGCSGIRYLLASFTVGAFYAWVMLRSPVRRAVFMAMSIVVPLVGNWLRAFGIVMLGHLSGNRLATGVDHLIYGWVFFGVLIVLLFWVGARWREEGEEPSAQASAAAALAPGAPKAQVGAAVIVALAIAGTALFGSKALLEPRATTSLPALQAEPAGGWTEAASADGWRPHLLGPQSEFRRTYVKDGRSVGLHVAIYRNQQQGSELVASGNVLVRESEGGLRALGSEVGAVQRPDGAVPYRATRLADNRVQIVVRHWYWTGRTRTTSDLHAKLDLVVDRLLGRDDTAAWVAYYLESDGAADAAVGVLDDFERTMGPRIEQGLARLHARAAD